MSKNAATPGFSTSAFWRRGRRPLACGPHLVEAADRRGDRRAVDVLEVDLPVDDRRVEGERLLVRLRERPVERQRVGVGEPQLRLRVLLVEPEVAAQELQPPALLVELAGQVTRAVAARRVADDVVGDLEGPLAGAQQPLDGLRAGEAPLGQPGRAAVAGLERVRVEVGAHVLVERRGTSAGCGRPTRRGSTPGSPTSGGCARTATIAATTWSTGTTSTVVSAAPGISGSSPRP